MIKRNAEGHYFESDMGIVYDLLEGVTMGGKEVKTSDIIFVVISGWNIDIDLPANHFVGYLYGATFLDEQIFEYEREIAEMVNKYELEHGLC